MSLKYTPKAGRKPDMEVDFATGLLTQDPITVSSYPTGLDGDMTYVFGVPFMWIGEQHLLPVTGSDTTSSNYVFGQPSTQKALLQFPLRILEIKSYFLSGMDPTDYNGTNGKLDFRMVTAGASFIGPLDIKTAADKSVCFMWPNAATGTIASSEVVPPKAIVVELVGRLEDGSGSTPTLKLITQIMMIRVPT